MLTAMIDVIGLSKTAGCGFGNGFEVTEMAPGSPCNLHESINATNAGSAAGTDSLYSREYLKPGLSSAGSWHVAVLNSTAAAAASPPCHKTIPLLVFMRSSYKAN